MHVVQLWIILRPCGIQYGDSLIIRYCGDKTPWGTVRVSIGSTCLLPGERVECDRSAHARSKADGDGNFSFITSRTRTYKTVLINPVLGSQDHIHLLKFRLETTVQLTEVEHVDIIPELTVEAAKEDDAVW